MSKCGQSIWLDYISRSLTDTGRLQGLVAQGLRGLTSNPTIFDNAVSRSSDYDSRIRELRIAGKKTLEIYDAITVEDIQDAADAFASVYENTDGLDGYVSLEINPRLAHDADATVVEGKRLHRKVNRSNIMFKVPATDAGFSAIPALLAESINVNVTLIFSLDQYMKTAEVYLRGIEELLKNRGDARKVRSVASVFVSRVDTLTDRLLEENLKSTQDGSARSEMERLKGKAAIANAAIIYDRFREIFSSENYRRISRHGGNLQRVLWGSTSTKNPEYSDIKYVTELIGRDTVNTIPEETLEAFIDHGVVKESLPGDTRQARETIGRLNHVGIDINEICEKLLEDGAGAFQRSFDSLLRAIEQKASEVAG
ncbi:transaldolase [candidate division WOR-3 bacterium]|nr:transaldolase [candidate division WOR-3 bacterium]